MWPFTSKNSGPVRTAADAPIDRDVRVCGFQLSLLDDLLSPEEASFISAAQQCAVFLDNLLPQEWAAFDGKLREAIFKYASGSAWGKLRPDNFPMPQHPETRRIVVVLASMHPSGFVRAHALALWPETVGSADVAALVVRMTDSVPAIRKEAERRLDCHFDGLPPSAHVALLPLMHFLEQRQRFSTKGWFARSVAKMTAPDSAAAFSLGLRRTRGRAFEAFWRAIPALPHDRRRECWQWMLNRGEPSYRLRALKMLVETAPVSERSALWEAASRHRSPAVRAHVLEARKPLLSESEFLVCASRALADPDAWVRLTAAHYIRGAAAADALIQSARAVLARGEGDVAQAVFVLTELSDGADADAVAIHVGAGDSRVRHAAYLYLIRRTPAASMALIIAGLKDGLPAIVRLCAGHLSKVSIGAYQAELLDLLKSAPAHARPRVIKLMAATDRRGALATVMRFAVRDDTACSNVAERVIRTWINSGGRLYYLPTSEQLTCMLAVFAEVRSRLSPGLADELQRYFSEAQSASGVSR